MPLRFFAAASQRMLRAYQPEPIRVAVLVKMQQIGIWVRRPLLVTRIRGTCENNKTEAVRALGHNVSAGHNRFAFQRCKCSPSASTSQGY